MAVRKIFFILALIVPVIPALSQSCLPNGITFTNQEQIDNFAANFPDCTEIEGFVTINDAVDGNITNLFGLIQLSHIGGDLQIIQNEALEQLTGLHFLQSVGGSVWITQNPTITTLDGLNNLQSVGGFFQVSFNDNLFNLNGIEKLNTVSTYFAIQFNETLSNLDGINNLASVGTFFTIQQNPNLKTIESFPQLVSVDGFFTIQFNDELEMLSGFDNLHYVGDFMTIQQNHKLNTINGFEMVDSIGGFLSIRTHNSLESIYGFDQLRVTGAFISILQNPQLDWLEAFDRLKNIGGSLIVRDNLLGMVRGFQQLEHIEGNIIVDNCNNLTILFNDMMSPESINGNIEITNNDELASIWGIREIDASTIESVTITGNPNLSECDVKSICYYLDLPDHVSNLENNLPGCNNEEEIHEKCGLHPDCSTLTQPLDGLNNVLVNTPLSWETIPEATGYYLSLGLESGHFNLIDFEDIGSDTSYNLPFNLPCLSDIYVKIYPYNAEGMAFDCIEEMFSTEVIADAGTNATICAGTSIQLNASGGTQVIWTPIIGLDNPFSLTPVASPPSSTMYYATLSNGNNCSSVDSVLVTVLSSPKANAISTNETGADFNDGTMSCFPDEGLPPFQIEWSTGDTTNFVDSLPPAIYTVTVTDANLCQGVDTVTIYPYNCPDLIPFYTSMDMSCFGICDGVIYISNVSNAIPPINYRWNTEDTVNLIEDLCPGLYTLTITDAKNCSVETEYELTEPNALVTSILSTDETGNDFNDGSAIVQTSGGTPPYTYLWSNGSENKTIINLNPGWYYVTITDTKDCVETDSAFIEAYICPELSLESVVGPASCFGVCDGSIVPQISGGTPPFTYLWEPENSGAWLDNLCAGNYGVTITDSKNCSVSESFIIEQPAEIVYWVVEVIDVRIGLPGSIDMEVDNELAYSYAWTGPNNFTSSDLDIDSLEIGCYTLVITQLQTGCTQDTTICVQDLTIAKNLMGDKTKVKYYPNPNRGLLTVSVNGPILPNARLEIVRMDGKVVYKQAISQNKTVLDIKELPEGVYLARIFHSGKMDLQKLIYFK